MYIDCVYTCTSLYFAFCTLHMYDMIFIYIHIMYTYLTYMFYSSSYFLYMSCANHVYTVNEPLWIYLKSNLYLLCNMHVLHCLRYYGTRLSRVFTLTSFSFTSVHLGKMTKQTLGEGVMGSSHTQVTSAIWRAKYPKSRTEARFMTGWWSLPWTYWY